MRPSRTLCLRHHLVGIQQVLNQRAEGGQASCVDSRTLCRCCSCRLGLCSEGETCRVVLGVLVPWWGVDANQSYVGPRLQPSRRGAPQGDPWLEAPGPSFPVPVLGNEAGVSVWFCMRCPCPLGSLGPAAQPVTVVSPEAPGQGPRARPEEPGQGGLSASSQPRLLCSSTTAQGPTSCLPGD